MPVPVSTGVLVLERKLRHGLVLKLGSQNDPRMKTIEARQELSEGEVSRICKKKRRSSANLILNGAELRRQKCCSKANEKESESAAVTVSADVGCKAAAW